MRVPRTTITPRGLPPRGRGGHHARPTGTEPEQPHGTARPAVPPFDARTAQDRDRGSAATGGPRGLRSSCGRRAATEGWSPMWSNPAVRRRQRSLRRLQRREARQPARPCRRHCRTWCPTRTTTPSTRVPAPLWSSMKAAVEILRPELVRRMSRRFRVTPPMTQRTRLRHACGCGTRDNEIANDRSDRCFFPASSPEPKKWGLDP